MDKIKPLIQTDDLYSKISEVIKKSRNKAYKAINTAMINQYWEVGRLIVEEEQKGSEKAAYGDYLIFDLATKLSTNYGKGYNRTNLKYMRQFYLSYPIGHAVSDQLTWTHYRMLLKVEDQKIRDFYAQEAIKGNWSTRRLDHEISSLLYERVYLSTDKKGTIEISEAKDEKSLEPKDIIKEPYILPFLGFKRDEKVSESNLQDALIDHIQEFLMELGRGFAFVSKEQRISVDTKDYYVDLVFYNYILKCFFLVDLKVGELTHKDVGQMDFYVRYYEKEIRDKNDNPTIGLILCAAKNETMVKYTLLEDSNQIFASKYKLYLPSENELREELEKNSEAFEIEKKLELDE